MATVVKQMATGAGGAGSSGAGIILLNWWLKAHNHQELEPQQVAAIMTVVAPVTTVILAVIMALLMKFLNWAKIQVPGVNEPAPEVKP
ncbi:MAG: hypothetical protein KGL39_46065 [Patescibacteria group bacterium]|nr:hypothetical protein [Patescibacteria group bacterium]